MLSPRHRLFAYWTLGVVFASGSLHFLLHQFLQTAGPFGAQPRPIEPWVLRLHGAAAMATLLLIGSVVPTHVTRWWRAGRNRIAGVMLLGLAAVLVVTGYALYYSGVEALRLSARWLHITTGVAALPAFLIHLSRGRTAAKPAPIRPMHRTQGHAHRGRPLRRK